VRSATAVQAGGWSLIGGAIAFLAVFSYLAARFDYPAILDGPASSVLPKLLETGGTGRAVWALYAILPLVWLPAGVGAYRALRRSHPGAMLLALQLASLAAISMMLGLMRWPSVHWHLAQMHSVASTEQRAVIASVFDGLNSYLGNYLGEFLGELCFNAFFLLTGWAMWRSGVGPRWAGVAGMIVAILGFAGMFRNVTMAVAPIAEINNYLLPLWMIVLGAILLRLRPAEEGALLRE